jgi:phosphosulfolactate synthase
LYYIPFPGSCHEPSLWKKYFHAPEAISPNLICPEAVRKIFYPVYFYVASLFPIHNYFLMNFNLGKIPLRSSRPRTSGLTIISDKGLSLAEAKNLLSVADPYIDMVKLAFGTAVVTSLLKEKIALYQSYQIPVYFGGLLFEAYMIRNQVPDFIKLVESNNIDYIEVSDGASNITHRQKCDYIRQFCKTGTVISEVGAGDKDKVQVTPPYRWIEIMQEELDAGARYIVAEGEESGTAGIYRDSGEVREGLVAEILNKIAPENIIWEAPKKDQQLYFIKLLGCNANMANIAPAEVIALEAMRIGLRGDSFDFFLT